ncbi:MAG TPA: hypothetical protein DCE56_17055 [Cyanobacteria bacterium UBA8553]|nr:hypothetical protein [Cyanobacteria bacterium UBA8553]HAJ64569.1 hypothetical protein [Cyanobacteria bacterium UBA8543]
MTRKQTEIYQEICRRREQYAQAVLTVSSGGWDVTAVAGINNGKFGKNFNLIEVESFESWAAREYP